MQCEDGGPWMCGVIKEANRGDQNGRSYVFRVTKTGRLIILNTRHMHNTPINTEQYLQEQIKKGTGQLEDIFMETIPVDYGKLLKMCTADSWMHVVHNV